jgi:hypothetical protein
MLTPMAVKEDGRAAPRRTARHLVARRPHTRKAPPHGARNLARAMRAHGSKLIFAALNGERTGSTVTGRGQIDSMS